MVNFTHLYNIRKINAKGKSEFQVKDILFQSKINGRLNFQQNSFKLLVNFEVLFGHKKQKYLFSKHIVCRTCCKMKGKHFETFFSFGITKYRMKRVYKGEMNDIVFLGDTV